MYPVFSEITGLSPSVEKYQLITWCYDLDSGLKIQTMLLMRDYNEIHRPRFHFTARENWINDPNGLVYNDGVWHLFFQHNPESTVWGNMTWGHAVSNDLLHWRQLEHALYPDELGTMFSGSAVVDHEGTAGFGKGALLAFYTAAGVHVTPKQPFTQCLAYSTDNGMSWQKYVGNPVVEWFEDANRDPKVIWHENSQHWIMALYLTANQYCLLRSADAKLWTRFQDLTLPGVTECPDFFPLQDESGSERWIFWGAKGRYQVGSFDGQEFVPETGTLVCEHGLNGYAAQTWSDAPDNRRIQMSWMVNGLYPEMPFNQQMSIPVELGLSGSGNDVTLKRCPVSELDTLRKNSIRPGAKSVTRDQPLIVDTEEKLIDVAFTVTRQAASVLRVIVRGQPLVFNWAVSELQFRNHSIPLDDAPSLSVRLLVDRASVEIFLNGGLITASFCFLPGAYIHPLLLYSDDGEQKVNNLEVHELYEIWEK